ncbi:hypothetical protein [Marinobacter confluentis]|uniref:Uncharacterized protein n=1 Tax=Marinobacter confluentis TaxID=1697557 RepID=A0A4Z1BWH0_9GAMM|nr:hypothetical protein [Marinobacter confluentis]TGN41669.1 hypothetical protein E5Q11_03835 [Marinobacter confluentis]
MDYGDSVQKVLLRKIQKAEQDLVQLKLDYCRFIFGLNHRSKVTLEGATFTVRSVDVDSMKRQEDDTFSKPEISGLPEGSDDDSDIRPLGTDWVLVSNESV